MKKKVFKKIAAGSLAAALIITQGTFAGAEVIPDTDFNGTAADPDNGGQTQTGTATFEGHRSKNVIKAIVPTVANEDIYNAVLDPESLIFETMANVLTDDNGATTLPYANPAMYTGDFAAYAEGGFPEGTLLFKNATPVLDDDGNATGDYTYSYSTTSDPISVINKGTVPLDVKLAVDITGATGLEISDDPTFANAGRKASIYFAALDADDVATSVAQKQDDTGADVPGAANATIKSFVAGADESLYHTESVAGSGASSADAATGNLNYNFVANDAGDNDAYARYTFRLTGACNPNGVYTASTPNINIAATWTLNECYAVSDEPVANVIETTDAGAQEIYLYSDKNATPLISAISGDAAVAADVFDAAAVKVQGPGMTGAVTVTGTLANVDPDDATAGKRLKVTRADLASAVVGDTANGGDSLAYVDADGNVSTTEVAGGAYRIFYTVGTTQFVSIVQLEDPVE